VPRRLVGIVISPATEAAPVQNPIRVPEDFGYPEYLLLNPSGTLLGVFACDREVGGPPNLALYSATDGQRVGEPLKLEDSRGLGFISDDTLFIANERTLLRWQPPNKPELVPSSGAYLYGLAVCPARDIFALVVEEGEGYYAWRVLIGNIRTGNPLLTIDAPLDLKIGSAALSPGGRFVAIGLTQMRCEERALMICNAQTGQRVQTFYAPRGAWNVTFAPDEASLFCFVEEGIRGESLALFDLGSGDPIRHFALPDTLGAGLAIFFPPDPRRLNVLGRTGACVQFDRATGRALNQFDPPVPLAENTENAVSANGRVAAGVAQDHTVVVWALGD
jgi:hypothetical protein